MNDAERIDMVVTQLEELMFDLKMISKDLTKTQFKRVEEPKIGDSL